MFSELLRAFRNVPAGGRVPPGIRVYVVGDIHGRADLLATLHQAIERHARGAAPGTRKFLIYLGDYIDRGPGSRQVIDLLVKRPLAGFEPAYLKGNHEDVMLTFLEEENLGHDWLSFGGDSTVMSYGLRPPLSYTSKADVKALQRGLRTILPHSHRQFLTRLQLYTVVGSYLFVHAGIRPGVRLDQQSPRDLMWIREPFLRSRKDHGYVVVHGHTITDTPEIRSNRIGIDTGAYGSNVLTCMVLEGDRQEFLSTALADDISRTKVSSYR